MANMQGVLPKTVAVADVIKSALDFDSISRKNEVVCPYPKYSFRSLLHARSQIFGLRHPDECFQHGSVRPSRVFLFLTIALLLRGEVTI